MALRLVDTHTHLDFTEYADDREAVIERAQKVGVEKMINIGCDEKHFKSSLELACGREAIYATIGMHPQEAMGIETAPEDTKTVIDTVVKKMEGYLNYKKLVGIGEIGLDFYRIIGAKMPGHSSIIDVQYVLFKRQIELAIKADLPLVIHSRDSYNEVYNVLKEYKTANNNLRGVLHSFEGDFSVAANFIELGFKLSFNGTITYDMESEVARAVHKIPLEAMMVETECPYMTPVPLRGQRNEPANVEYVVAKIAELKKMEVGRIGHETTENAIKFFKLD